MIINRIVVFNKAISEISGAVKVQFSLSCYISAPSFHQL